MQIGSDTHDFSDDAIELIAGRFRIFAEPMRLRILLALGEKELCVGEIVETTGAQQANISKHLGILLEAGMVKKRKDGLNSFYRIVDPTILELCGTVCSSLREKIRGEEEAVKSFARR